MVVTSEALAAGRAVKAWVNKKVLSLDFKKSLRVADQKQILNEQKKSDYNEIRNN